jgi:hypothetical protein
MKWNYLGPCASRVLAHKGTEAVGILLAMERRDDDDV